MWRPSGVSSLPQAYSAPSRPPRAANSHSASVGSSLPGPPRVGLGVLERDVHHRVIPQALQRRCRGRADGASRRPARRSTRSGRPDRPARRPVVNTTDEGTSSSGWRARVVGGVRGPLRQRDVPGGVDEAAEVGVRHGRPIHPEAVHLHAVRGRLFGVVIVRTHQELAAGHPRHGLVGRGPVGLRRACLRCVLAFNFEDPHGGGREPGASSIRACATPCREWR